MNFKEKFNSPKRRDESARIRKKYPDRIPIIVEKSCTEKYLKTLDKSKYLVPKDLTVGQFSYVIRRRLKIEPEKSMFILCNNSILPPSSQLVGDLYKNNQCTDGFLYVTYCSENTFGN